MKFQVFAFYDSPLLDRIIIIEYLHRSQLCTFPWEFSWTAKKCDSSKDKGSPLIMQMDDGRLFSWIVYCVLEHLFNIHMILSLIQSKIWFRFTLIGMNRGICYRGKPDVYISFLHSEVSTWIKNVMPAKPYDEKSICSSYSEWTQTLSDCTMN